MNLLKSASFILCMVIAGCSSNSDKPAEVSIVPEPVIDPAWMDGYEPRLRDALKDSRFELERREGVLVVTAPVDASFNPDRPGMLLPVTLGPLSRVAKLVEGDEKTAVVVLGHADSTGSADVNRDISRQRAGAVAAIFRLSGLKHNRLRIRGLGSDVPRASNENEEGRALNRRVEMVLAPQPTLLALIGQYSEAPNPTQVAAAEVTKAK
ncbi:membrane protein [Stutzerimonas stutzeri]|uniref:Membrane protein n=1 Tax=Stutzerimonas stutzeri TaxID=316 RepID=W8QWP4_STUST|nr:OmpA family protein [Stutzerimonas stutzeri]AHL74729.1 membrane protein [Stutzerimonas stutzeri]MCQ4329259.1 OmpA family protein [Stutzerimonas stutzeri]